MTDNAKLSRRVGLMLWPFDSSGYMARRDGYRVFVVAHFRLPRGGESSGIRGRALACIGGVDGDEAPAWERNAHVLKQLGSRPFGTGG